MRKILAANYLEKKQNVSLRWSNSWLA